MITKEIWDDLTQEQQHERLTNALADLHAIETGTHPLVGKSEQGSLTQVKKDLETLVLKIIEWENS